MANKVKFNLKNVHFCPISQDGTFNDSDIFALPGAVSLSLDANGDIEKFYADGIVYFQSVQNNGYEGTLEMALLSEDFRTKILGERADSSDTKMLYENVNDNIRDFAMGFQIDGDANNTCFWFFNGKATRPGISAQTNEATKTPQTETLNVSFAPDSHGDVRAKKICENETQIETFFASVPTRTA